MRSAWQGGCADIASRQSQIQKEIPYYEYIGIWKIKIWCPHDDVGKTVDREPT